VAGIFGDIELEASAPSEAGGSLTVIGAFSDTTVRVPPGSRVGEGASACSVTVT
jgi:hypothetical protein